MKILLLFLQVGVGGIAHVANKINEELILEDHFYGAAAGTAGTAGFATTGNALSYGW